MSLTQFIDKNNFYRETTTKDTENSSFSGEFRDTKGLFTFSKCDLKNAAFLNEKYYAKQRNLSENRLRQKNISIDQRIKDKEIENQILFEKIKSKKIEINNDIYSESNSLTQAINKTQKNLEALRERLYNLQQINKSLKYKQEVCLEQEALYKENSVLHDKINQIKQKIHEQKYSNITLEESSKLANCLKILEDDQFNCIQQKIALNKQLLSIRQSNYLKECFLISANDREQLLKIYGQISKFNAIAKKLSKKQVVKINEITQEPYHALNTTPNELITMIKKETSELKLFISDLYAEQSGNICESI